MKTTAVLCSVFVILGVAQAGTPDLVYLQVKPRISGEAPLSDAGIMGGCYIGPGRECQGMFYIKDDSHGILVGSVINDLVAAPEFELLYSLTLTKEAGRDMLIGSAYAMELSPEGDILGGRRTAIRQSVVLGEEIVLAQPVGWLRDGRTIFLQMSANTHRSEPDDMASQNAVTLVSTQFAGREQRSRVSNSYRQLSATHAFRMGFRSAERNGASEVLRYDVRVRLDSDLTPDLSTGSDLVRRLAQGRLSFSRTYVIDTLNYPHASFSPDVTYKSNYVKDIRLERGKMLKLVFPPDTPSVRGFDIEDTLIIVPR